MASYNDIINLTPENYSKYLIEQLKMVTPEQINYTSIEGALLLSSKLVEISGLYSMVSSLLTLIIPAKREANRLGNKELYQDMIDKEAITSTFLKALDLRYKAYNRCLTVRESNIKELYMLKETT